jgi:hypothetical protein
MRIAPGQPSKDFPAHIKISLHPSNVGGSSALPLASTVVLQPPKYWKKN